MLAKHSIKVLVIQDYHVALVQCHGATPPCPRQTQREKTPGSGAAVHCFPQCDADSATETTLKTEAGQPSEVVRRGAAPVTGTGLASSPLQARPRRDRALPPARDVPSVLGGGGAKSRGR